MQKKSKHGEGQHTWFLFSQIIMLYKTIFSVSFEWIFQSVRTIPCSHLITWSSSANDIIIFTNVSEKIS